MKAQVTIRLPAAQLVRATMDAQDSRLSEGAAGPDAPELGTSAARKTKESLQAIAGHTPLADDNLRISARVATKA